MNPWDLLRHFITVHHTSPHHCTPYVTSSLSTIRHLITVHHVSPSLHTICHFITGHHASPQHCVNTFKLQHYLFRFFCFLLPFSCCRHHLDRLQIFFQNTSSLSGLISSIIIPNGSPSLLSLPEGSFPQVSLQGSPTLMLHFTPAPKTPLLNCL